jgi:predicted oxidoreductase (fatty acid repression mutant protein)
MNTTQIELGDGVTFRFYGPQTEHRLYQGFVGLSPEFNNSVIDQLMRVATKSEVTSLACSSSEWVVLEFEEHQREWVIERLREIVTQKMKSATQS